MTIREAIDRIDEIKPSGYSDTQFIEWLNNLDAMVYREIILTHVWDDTPEFSPYTQDTDAHTTLLIPDEFSDVYVSWLAARIDYANGEFSRYNNSAAMFNAQYDDYAAYINRTHMPKGTKGIRI